MTLYTHDKHGDTQLHPSVFQDARYMPALDATKAPRRELHQLTPRAMAGANGLSEPGTPQIRQDGVVLTSLPSDSWGPLLSVPPAPDWGMLSGSTPGPGWGGPWAESGLGQGPGPPMHERSPVCQAYLGGGTGTALGSESLSLHPTPVRTAAVLGDGIASGGSPVPGSTGLTPRIADMAMQPMHSWPRAMNRSLDAGSTKMGGGVAEQRDSKLPRPPQRADVTMQAWKQATAAVPAALSLSPPQRSALSAPVLTDDTLLLPHLDPASAVVRFGHLLAPFERAEIGSFPRVWFVGRAGVAKVASAALGGVGAPPPVFADERGDYLVVPGDHIAYRYEIQAVLGQGSFGQVLRCADHAAGGRPVALKVMRGKRRFYKQAVVETRILALLQNLEGGCPGTVEALGSFTFRGHLCIAFELLSINLYELLQERRMLGCGAVLVRRVARQVLESLSALLDARVVHCDIKPENIMLVDRKHSDVKLIDFGSSCFRDKRSFTYIQSRFYRAPEVILGLPYGHPIDMWSFACVLAEMRTGCPLFPGEDEKDQLGCILEILGPAPTDMACASPRSASFFDTDTGEPLASTLSTKHGSRRVGTLALTRALGCVVGRDASFVRFLQACLRWTPEHRLTPCQALRHDWILEG